MFKNFSPNKGFIYTKICLCSYNTEGGGPFPGTGTHLDDVGHTHHGTPGTETEQGRLDPKRELEIEDPPCSPRTLCGLPFRMGPLFDFHSFYSTEIFVGKFEPRKTEVSNKRM